MSQNNREIESRGQTVESAIQAGLKRLGLDLSGVDVTVVDEGSRGLLGIGSRDAVVRLTVKAVAAPSPPQPEPKPQPEPEPVVEVVADLEPTAVEPEPEPKPVQEAPPKPKTAVSSPSIPSSSTDERVDETETAVEILEALFDKMGISNIAITARQSEPDSLTGRQIAEIEIQGEDLGDLIGPRGDTLYALQHISRLMVAQKLRQRANFVIDIDGYREKREQALTRLAERMAGKVVTRGNPISLEPMPANERRIIHIALRDSEEVYTESVGEGKRRKVRILPK